LCTRTSGLCFWLSKAAKSFALATSKTIWTCTHCRPPTCPLAC
jgi:hypothetical protein